MGPFTLCVLCPYKTSTRTLFLTLSPAPFTLILWAQCPHAPSTLTHFELCSHEPCTLTLCVLCSLSYCKLLWCISVFLCCQCAGVLIILAPVSSQWNIQGMVVGGTMGLNTLITAGTMEGQGNYNDYLG